MKFGIYTTMEGLPWGGSEELWSQAADVLLDRGHGVHVSYRKWSPIPSRLHDLQSRGAVMHWRKTKRLYGRSVRRLLSKLRLEHAPHLAWLSAAKPEFVLINAGFHLDDMSLGLACQKQGIPYSILVQAAGYPSWLHHSMVDSFRRAYQGANACFFVSEDNQRILETNLATSLDNAVIVDNPFNVSRDTPDWPEQQPCKIACVGRFHFQSKGQDVLVDVLRSEKWRQRGLTVHLFGKDDGSERQLRELIDLYRLHDSLVMEGFSGDITEVWADHQALILPSRYEGNSLATVEAIHCGRVPIVTDVGRNRELVIDNETGFLAAAAVPSLVDEALERAWQRRHSWREMGQKGANRLKTIYSADPPQEFARALEDASRGKVVPLRSAAA